MSENENYQPKVDLSKIEFPEGLTEKDRVLIVRQCELQNATKKENIEGMAAAYKEAKDLARDADKMKAMTAEDWEVVILKWGAMIDEVNEKGYRQGPAVFSRGTSGADQKDVPDRMKRFFKMCADPAWLTAEEAYLEFESIHPWEDGNGREGDLLWKIKKTQETGYWPEELPPRMDDIKGTGSAFGEVED